jgi:hypothetical protein
MEVITRLDGINATYASMQRACEAFWRIDDEGYAARRECVTSASTWIRPLEDEVQALADRIYRYLHRARNPVAREWRRCMAQQRRARRTLRCSGPRRERDIHVPPY